MAGEPAVRVAVKQQNMLVRFAVYQALRDGTWWRERQKINGGK